MYKSVDVYLQKRETRQYVGRLSRHKGKFIFEYNETYMYNDHPIALGPDLPVYKKTHRSSKLFPSFEDRIPLRANPAYEEYCQSVGISPSEKDPLVLLATLGQRGPSSFIFAPGFENQSFSKEDLKKFRKKLNLSIRDFSKLFDISSATIYRIENNKTSGKNILKQIEIYSKYPEIALDKIKHTGVRIKDQKRDFIENFFKSK